LFTGLHIARVSLNFTGFFKKINWMKGAFRITKKYNGTAAGLSVDFTAHPG